MIVMMPWIFTGLAMLGVSRRAGLGIGLGLTPRWRSLAWRRRTVRRSDGPGAAESLPASTGGGVLDIDQRLAVRAAAHAAGERLVDGYLLAAILAPNLDRHLTSFRRPTFRPGQHN
jgi:hypothetical protein